MFKKNQEVIKKDLYYFFYQNNDIKSYKFIGIINNFVIHNINTINSFKINYLGGPIMDLQSYKVIGIIKEFKNKDNIIGTLIKPPIYEFYKSFNKQNIQNNDILIEGLNNKIDNNFIK